MSNRALILHEAGKRDRDGDDNRRVNITNYYYRSDNERTGERMGGYPVSDYPMNRMTEDYTRPRMGWTEPVRSTYPMRDNMSREEYKPVVGFGDRDMRVMYPSIRNEMGSIAGTMERGHGEVESYPKATREIAEGWLKSMKNFVGTSRVHWSYEQSKEAMTEGGFTADPIDWWVALKMMYSDYHKVAKRMGIDNIDFYAAMADAFLNDPDAGEDKLSTYMYCVK
ncbi:MAG: hypothetical protein KBS60_04160 [Phascolarctobacterium sp.]|nr:hypothetical protein [Candidatus Phascolarctobacterium caballi]